MATTHRYYLGTSGTEQPLTNKGLTVTAGVQRLAEDDRLASGLLVRDTVATKQVFELAWRWLESRYGDVEDGGLGRTDLKELYETGGELSLFVPSPDGGHEQVDVLFDGNFDEALLLSEPTWYWDVTITLVEI